MCRTGSVLNAAEALHITRGAVSQQLKLLEDELQVKLLQKAGRELELTKAGRQLGRRVADAFDRIDNALSDVSQDVPGLRLRLKVVPSLAIRWLVPRLASFYALHDDIDIELATTSRGDDQQLEQADFVVRHGRGEWSDVEFDHLFDDEFIPVCSPALAANIETASDLLRGTLLHSMMRPEAWAVWFTSVRLAQKPSRRGVSLANAALCCQAAVDGLGVAMIQRAYVMGDIATGKLVVPVDHAAITEAGYYLVCDPMKADTFAIKAFRDWIRTVR